MEPLLSYDSLVILRAFDGFLSGKIKAFRFYYQLNSHPLYGGNKKPALLDEAMPVKFTLVPTSGIIVGGWFIVAKQER